LRKYSFKYGAAKIGCKIEFMKHVLPILRKPHGTTLVFSCADSTVDAIC
jgi:hypothetical protein